MTRDFLDNVVFLTSNPGKAREASRFLGREISTRALELPEIQAVEFEPVVREKAIAAFRLLGVPCLVEDSGLTVRAWNGYPGALTRWVTDSVGEEGLARMLDPFADRRAEAVSALGLASEGRVEVEVLVAVGRVPGRLAAAPRGANGFGWDVLFVPEGDTRTFAEMEPEEKHRFSHRARAFEKLREVLAARETRPASHF